MQPDGQTALRDVSAHLLDTQERAAWALIAEGCERALRELDPHHPERPAFTEMWTDIRAAAGAPITGEAR